MDGTKRGRNMITHEWRIDEETTGELADLRARCAGACSLRALLQDVTTYAQLRQLQSDTDSRPDGSGFTKLYCPAEGCPGVSHTASAGGQIILYNNVLEPALESPAAPEVLEAAQSPAIEQAR